MMTGYTPPPATGGVSSVFGRTDVVTAQTGDYTAAQVGAVSSAITTITTSGALSANTAYRGRTTTWFTRSLPETPPADTWVELSNEGVGNVYFSSTDKINGVNIVQGVVRRGGRARFVYVDVTTGWSVQQSEIEVIVTTSLVAAWNPETGATDVSGKCSALADLSASGHTVSQGTAANRPVISTYNGHQLLTYSDGDSTKLFRASSVAFDLASYTVTVFLIPDSNANATAQAWFAHSDSANNGVVFYLVNNTFAWYHGPNNYIGVADVQQARPVILQGSFEPTGTNLLRVSIGGERSALLTASDVGASTDDVILGASSAGQFSDGKMGILILRNAAVSPGVQLQDRRFVEAVYY